MLTGLALYKQVGAAAAASMDCHLRSGALRNQSGHRRHAGGQAQPLGALAATWPQRYPAERAKCARQGHTCSAHCCCACELLAQPFCLWVICCTLPHCLPRTCFPSAGRLVSLLEQVRAKCFGRRPGLPRAQKGCSGGRRLRRSASWDRLTSPGCDDASPSLPGNSPAPASAAASTASDCVQVHFVVVRPLVCCQ